MTKTNAPVALRQSRPVLLTQDDDGQRPALTPALPLFASARPAQIC